MRNRHVPELNRAAIDNIAVGDYAAVEIQVAADDQVIARAV
jgi:hypothetical protein